MPYTTKLTEPMLTTLKRDLNGFLMNKSDLTINELWEELESFLGTHEYGPFKPLNLTPLTSMTMDTKEITSTFGEDRAGAVFEIFSKKFESLNSFRLIVESKDSQFYFVNLSFDLNIWMGSNANDTEEVQPIIDEFMNNRAKRGKLFGKLLSIMEWITDGTFLGYDHIVFDSDKALSIPVSRAFVKEIFEINEQTLNKAFKEAELIEMERAYGSTETEEPTQEAISEDERWCKKIFYDLQEITKKRGDKFYKKDENGELVQF